MQLYQVIIEYTLGNIEYVDNETLNRQKVFLNWHNSESIEDDGFQDFQIASQTCLLSV